MTSSKRILLVTMLAMFGCVEDSPENRAVGGIETPADDTSQGDAGSEAATDTSPAYPTDGSTEGDSLAWTTEEVHVERSVPQIAVVDEIRSGKHETYDRLVIEFQNNIIPSYHVGYLEEQPIECGSGESITVPGNATLEIRLDPARGHDEQGKSTVDHGARNFDLSAMLGSEISCDFEAVFTTVLGLTEWRPFRVNEFRDPARLVVDIKHTEN